MASIFQYLAALELKFAQVRHLFAGHPGAQPLLGDRELMITATLPGSGDWGSQRDALAFEQAAIAEETALQALLVREKVEAARRAMLLYPQQLSWNWWDDVTVELRFWLPAGSFATSVVRELINTTGDYANIAE